MNYGNIFMSLEPDYTVYKVITVKAHLHPQNPHDGVVIVHGPSGDIVLSKRMIFVHFPSDSEHYRQLIPVAETTGTAGATALSARIYECQRG
jgi:hypothetical protein